MAAYYQLKGSCVKLHISEHVSRSHGKKCAVTGTFRDRFYGNLLVLSDIHSIKLDE